MDKGLGQETGGAAPGSTPKARLQLAPGPQLGTSGLLSIVQDITYPGRLHHQGAQGGIKAGEGEAEASGVSFEEESEEEEDHRKDSCRRGGDLL